MSDCLPKLADAGLGTLGALYAISHRDGAELGDLLEEAAKTFIALRKKMLLGEISNAWLKTAEVAPTIARDPYCMALVPLIEQALVRGAALLNRHADTL